MLWTHYKHCLQTSLVPFCQRQEKATTVTEILKLTKYLFNKYKLQFYLKVTNENQTLLWIVGPHSLKKCKLMKLALNDGTLRKEWNEWKHL